MATLQGQYKAAIKKGLLDQSVTEEQFVKILENPNQRKAYYDNANQIISGAYGTYDSFSAAADEVLAAYKTQEKQPAQPQEPSQAVPTMPVGAAAYSSTDAAITMLMQQKDKEQKAAKEERARINAAQLPMSDDDRTREEQIRNIDATLSKVGVERFGSRMPIGDEREDVLQQQKQLEQERATLQGQRKNYMAEPTTVEEARESWIDAWSENTEEGKQAKADMEKAVLEAQNYLLEEFKKSDTFKSIYADVQGKVNRGELSVDAANKELNTRLEKAFVAENEELLNAEKNTQVQAYVQRALKADNGWLKRQEERLGEQALREALDENLDELNAAMKADYDAFAKSVGNGFVAAQAKSNYIEQQQLGVLGAAAQLLQETNTILSATKKGEEKVGSLSGEILRHTGDKLKSIATFGMSDTSSAMYQANVLKKIADAEAYDNPESVLDRNELVLYDAIVANMAAQIVRAENTSHLANAGKLTAEMIPFVMEIAIGKGLFSGMTKAAQRGVSRSILRSLGNGKWRRVIASQTGELLSGALESAAIAAIAPSTYKQIFQNEAKIAPTSLQLKDGKWTVGEIDQQSTGSAIWNAYRGNWREMFTETGGLTQFAAGFLKVSPLGKLIQKTPIGKLSQIMDNNFVGKMFKQTAYHGIAGELSEEWENTFYEATEAFLKAEKGKKWEAFGNVYGEFVKPETQVPMLISFSLPAIFGGAVTTGQMLAINSQYKKAYNNLRDTYMKYGATEEDFEDALNELVAAQLNVPIEQYPNVINAVATTLSGGNQEQANEFAAALSAYMVADANLGAIQEKHAKKQRQVQSMIHELEAAEQRIAQDTHTDGRMYHVEIGGKPGYFVRGTLPFKQSEGDEFARGIGDDIVTVRMEDGSIQQVAANQVKVLEQPQTAENAIEFERRRLTAKMNNLDRFKVGDVIYITENGQPIDGSSSRVVDVTDEGIVTEMVLPDGTVDTTTIPHDVAERGLSTSDELVEEGAESAVIEMPGGTLVTMQKTVTGDWMQVAPKTDDVSLISQREFDEMLADSGAKVVGGTIMEQPSTDDVASGNGVVSEEAGEIKQPTEQPTTEQPTADKPYATDEQGNPLWADMNTEQAVQALLSEVEGDKELAKQFAQAQVESAKAAVNKANKRKPQATNNLAAFKAEAQAIKQEQAAAQAELSKWENVVLAIANYKTEAEQTEVAQEIDEDIQPIGVSDFGEVYDQFKGKPKEAIEFLKRKKSGEALGALSHSEIGEIDLVWGYEGTGKSDGFGLSKLLKYHPEVVDNLQEILDDMHIVSQTETRIQLESERYKAAVRLTWDGERKTWLLTAFEKNSSVSDKTTDTTETHEGKQDDTALLQNTTISADKGTKNVPSMQENVQKTAEEQQKSASKRKKSAESGEKTQTDTKKAQEDKQKSVSAKQNFASTEQKSVQQNEKPQEVGEILETVDELDAKLAAAEAETDTNPTEAQKKAENYKQGHVTLWGLPFSIENPKGSVRRGTDANGKQWEQVMNNTYGKIRRTEGVDGDHIDVFFGPNLHSEKVFVVDQRNVNTGEFDEHKVMLGFDSMQEAQDAYLSNYEEGWQGMGPVTETTMDEFKKWIESSHRKTKPFSEYKSVKKEGGEESNNKELTEFATRLGAKGVHIVSSEDQLPKSEGAALKAIKSGVAVLGWFNPSNNQVYIYAPNAKSRQEVYSSLLHEFVSHRGLREMIGKNEFKNLCRKVWNAMGDADKLLYSAYVKYQLAVDSLSMKNLLANMSEKDKQELLNSEYYQLAAADEYMAHIADTGVSEKERSIWQKICDWIREALRKIGIDVKITDADIANLLRESSKRLSTDGSMREIADTIYENIEEFKIGNNSNTDYLNSKQEKTGQDIVGEIDTDDIRYSVSKNNRKTIEGWLNKRNDLTEQEKNAFWIYIEDEEPMKQLAMGRWFANGAIRLPEDQPTVDSALKMAKKMSVDPLKYTTPAAIIGEHQERFGKEEEKSQDQLLSPDDARFDGILTNKVDYGNGLVVYDVQNDEVGQNAVRELMNDHLGKGFNCWCLLYANASGEVTDAARNTWFVYNSTQKKVAFYEGKICSFCASKGSDSEWWDLSDISHKTAIPVRMAAPNDELGRYTQGVFKDGELLAEENAIYSKGSRKNGLYEEWYGADPHAMKYRATFKGGKLNGEVMKWHRDTQVESKESYKNGKLHGNAIEYDAKGTIVRKGEFKNGSGRMTHYFTNGNVKADYTYEDGNIVGGIAYYSDGKIRMRVIDADTRIWYNEHGGVEIYRGKNLYVGMSSNGNVEEMFWDNNENVNEIAYSSQDTLAWLSKRRALKQLQQKSPADYALYEKIVRGEMDLEPQDSRFSISAAEDKAYLDAVNSGDMATAEQMLRDAAERAGYLPQADYQDAHGAPRASVEKEDFTNAEAMQEALDNGEDTNLWAVAQGISIQPDDYFSPQGPRWYGYSNQSGMESYAALSSAIRSINSQLNEYGEVKDMPKVMTYRAVPTNIVGEQLESEGQWVTPSLEYAIRHGENRLEGNYRIIEQEVPADQLWWDGMDVREWGFDDGTINVYQNTENNRKLFEVTYDDNGNVIPLSKRFDTENEDIRFRVGTEVVEMGDNTLVGLHNISTAKLRKAIKQGGLANPSVAVINMAIQDHEQYGDITLVMPSSMIDSTTGKNAGTYTGDIWSPTYPYVERKMSSKGSDKYYDALDKAFEGKNRDVKSRTALIFVNMLDNQGNPDNLAYWYMLEKGIAPTDVIINSGISNDIKQRFEPLIDKRFASDLTTEERELLLGIAAELEGKTTEELLQAAQEAKKRYEDTVLANEKASQFSRNIALSAIDEIDTYGVRLNVLSDAMRRVREAIDKDGGVDVNATISAAVDYVQENGLKDDFDAWLDNLDDRFDIEEVIFDGYTRDGDRKYVKNTIANASRLMNQQPIQNATSHGGLSATRGQLVERMSTLAQIRANKHRLAAINEYEDEQWKAMQDEWFNEIINPLSEMQKIDDNPFINIDIAEQRLLEAIMEKDPIAYLNREYRYKIEKDSKFAKALKDLMGRLKALPSKYFETKFKRPVMLNEFVSAVVPQDLPQDLKDSLKEAGLDVYEYNDTEGSRREATIEATNGEGVRFRIGDDQLSVEENANLIENNLHNSKKSSTFAAEMEKLIESDAVSAQEVKQFIDKVRNGRKEKTLQMGRLRMDGTSRGNDLYWCGAVIGEAVVLHQEKSGVSSQSSLLGSNLFIEVAKQLNAFTDYDEFVEVFGAPIGQGQEAIVWVKDDDGDVVKALHYNALLRDNTQQVPAIIERISWFNHLFPENQLSLNQVLGLHNNNLYVEVTQGYVDGEHPNFEDWGEVGAFINQMQAKGFEATIERGGEIILYKDNFEVRDLVGRNVIKDEDGVFHVIDANISQEVKEKPEIRFSVDNSSDDIRFRISNENQRIFVSNAEKAVEGIKQDKATPQQWKAMIEKQGGLKAGEDKWLGLSEWLDEKANAKVEPREYETSLEYAKRAAKTITKQEILDFIAKNQIQIEEVEYGNDGNSIEETPAFKEFQQEYEQIFNDMYRGGGIDGWRRASEDAMEEMMSRHGGEDFGMAFYGEGNQLQVGDEYAALHFITINGSTPPINETRLDYTTEGLENKREIALTVPTIESWNEGDEVHFGDAGEGRAIAWVRFGETTDEEGNRTLVIDEIQSKRHQEGREKGYSDDYSKAEKEFNKASNEYDNFIWRMIDKYGVSMPSELRNVMSERELGIKDELDEAQQNARIAFRQSKKGIPSAPFEKNWHELAFKRILRYAAENGFDKVAWTTGAQQAERYDIGESVSNIIKKDEYEFKVIYKNGNTITLEFDEDGVYRDEYDRELDGKSMSDIFGKETAKKLQELPIDADLYEEGLHIGGEGMKGFYDKMLPSFVSKYVKKWGAKVGEVTMPQLEEGYQTMHSVDITPEMKESVMEGQVMFSISAKEVATDIWNKYQYDGELESVRDVAEYAEEHMPKNAQTQALFDAIDAYRIEEEEDRMYYGMRGDLEPFEDAILGEVEKLMGDTEDAALEEEQVRFSITDNDSAGERPSPEFVEAMRAWKEANPYPEFGKDGINDIAEFRRRLNAWNEARNAYRRHLYEKATKEIETADPIVEPLMTERPVRRKDETAKEYAQRLKLWQDGMIDRQMQEEYTAEMNRLASTANQAKRKFIDAAQPIEEWQNWLIQRGAKINGDSNAYQDMFLAQGRVTDASDDLRRNIIQPLASKIGEIIDSKKLDSLELRWSNMDVPGTGRKIDGKRLTPREIIGVYCQAKDCAEAEEKGLPDRGKEGFINNLGTKYDVIVSEVESRLSAEQIAELWNLIRKATKYALEYDYKSGRISEDTYNEFQDREYYVPQRGWRERDESGLIEEYEPVGKRGHDPYNAALVKARGRKTLAADPFAYIMSIDHSSIVSSENNKIKQKMLQFCLDNEELGLRTSAFRVKKYWLMHEIDPDTGKILKDEDGAPIVNISYTEPSAEEKKKDNQTKEQIKRIQKDIAKTTRQIEKGVCPKLETALKTMIARWEKQIADLEDALLIAWGATNTHISQRTRDEKMQHEVQVMKDGQRYVIELQDEKVANAINKRFKEHQQALFDVSDKIRNATRFMSAMLTQYNPEFAFSNFVRDYQVALATLLAEQPKLAPAFVANFAKCQRAVWVYAFNDRVRDRKKFVDSEMGRYLQEYFSSGAPTGFSYMQDLKSLRQDFDKMVNQGNVKRGIRAAAGMFALMTEWSETAVRFSAYVSARKAGWSVNDAAYMSKELTTNFDRAGEKADSGWMAWFSFFRATINGNIKFFRAMKKFPIPYSIIAAAYFAAGIANQFMNPNDPDDEVWASDFTRETNIVIGKWRIPVAHFMRIFFGAGVNLAAWMQGEKTFGHAVYNSTTGATREILPSYTDVWGNFIEWSDERGRVKAKELKKVIRDVAPTFISPFIDVWANRNFMGGTINREPFAKNQGDTKDILMAKDNTLPIYMAITEGVYTAVGGDLNSKYKLDDPWWRDWFFDISGSSVQHIAEGYFTGGMDMVATTANMIYDAAQGNELTPDKLAFIRKFYNPYTDKRAYDQQYWLLKGIVTEYERTLRDHEENNRDKYDLDLRSKQYQVYQDTHELIWEQKEEPTKDDVKQLMEANKKWVQARK